MTAVPPVHQDDVTAEAVSARCGVIPDVTDRCNQRDMGGSVAMGTSPDVCPTGQAC